MRNPFRRRPSLEDVLRMQRGLIIEKTTAIGGDLSWAISFDAIEVTPPLGGYRGNYSASRSLPKRVRMSVSDIGIATVSDNSLTGDIL